MLTLDFCHWLQGVLEISDGGLSEQQVARIQLKLDSVFEHEATPHIVEFPDRPVKVHDNLLKREDGARC
jgi:hypothetical protein